MTEVIHNARGAVVLLSGGLDSATTLAIALADGFACYALSFDYGQRHRPELEAARRMADANGVVEHRIAYVDLRVFGGSALTADVEVPKDRDLEDTTIPATYVPARNTIFLSYALAWAEVLGLADIYIGVNALDYSGYPDCRPEYIAAFETMANLATRAATEEGRKVRIRAPLIHSTKAQIIERGTALGVDFPNTVSCYDPTEGGAACGHCDSCRLRARGFQEAGISDPTRYAVMT